MPTFDKNWCREFEKSGSHEWLVTNGIGGYASGTVAGQLSRRYHGLLIAALSPPLGRTSLVSCLEDTIIHLGETFQLFTHAKKSVRVWPRGYLHLDRFHLEGTTPVWTFHLSGVRIEKRIWMEPGSNTTYIQYIYRYGSIPVPLQIRPLVNFRDHHSANRKNDWFPQVGSLAHGLRISNSASGTPFFLFSEQASFSLETSWHEDFLLTTETYRGLPDREDLFSPGVFSGTLSPGGSITITASTEPDCSHDGNQAYASRQAYEQKLVIKSGRSEKADWEKQLILAADQFIVQRSFPGSPQGHSVIAGYPWFGDWGRDTMISLPGLTMCTGRPEIARSILLTFARFIDQGMLPNNFPEINSTPGYNTVDATFWYFEAIRSYYQSTADETLISDLYPTLQEIIEWHIRGTRYNIHLDPEDGLIYAGEDGVQLTWMDAKIDDWVVTPRIGKPVEINALWYNALRIMESFSEILGKKSNYYQDLADQAGHGFKRFWNSNLNYCYDIIDGPDGNDPALRPNQVIAASLFYCPMDANQVRAVVDACIHVLLTPYGLRSLAPIQDSGSPDPNYIGIYGGNRRERDAAYHQGTVWGWLMGPFISAYLRSYGDPLQAKNYLKQIIEQLNSHGIGSLSEIFDGDDPYTPRGCIAQAWSVAEILRALTEIEHYPQFNHSSGLEK